MKIILLIVTCSLLVNAVFSQKTQTAKTNSQDIQNIKVPDYADPEIKQFYQSYISYTKKVLVAIRKKDEAAVMKLFKEEGNQFDVKAQEMEKRVRTNPTEEQKWKTYIIQIYPYQKEIIQSVYYKKFMEEYYKKKQ